MSFQYVSRTIRGPGCSTEWEEVLEGCDCQGLCSSEQKCSCLMSSEDNYEGNQIQYKASESPVFECHSDCSCQSNICKNRLLQKGITLKLKVKQIDGKGFGLIAEETILAKSFVCEYAGEIIGKEEAERRYIENPNDNYILTVRETCLENTTVTYVDPRFKGNLARFINHSCNPNLFLVPIRVGSSIPRIGLFASRDIQCGEELCYSYGSTRSSGLKKCLCGAASCFGYLPSELVL